MTIDKVQGQIFPNVLIDLQKYVFNHIHLYVEISRVRSWNGFKFYLGSNPVYNKVKNYVFKEIL